MDFFVSNFHLPPKRPLWAETDLAMMDYYDHHFGYPTHDDRQLFEMLTLEIFQAGLAWTMVWKRRADFQRAFANYDIRAIAAFDDQDFQRLLRDKTIIRNHQKILAVIKNARALCRMWDRGWGFDNYLWSQIDWQPLRIHPQADGRLPATIPAAVKMAQQLKKDGFSRTGPVTTFSFMCAAGLVNARLDN